MAALKKYPKQQRFMLIGISTWRGTVADKAP